MASGTAKKQKKAAARAPAAEASPRRRGWLWPGILVVATLLVFWHVCGSDFTTWDDYENVARNPRLNPATLDGVLYFWAHPHMAIYIPLTYTLWGAVASFARLPQPDASGIWLNPWLFHSTNLLVHLLAVCFAYLLLNALTGESWAAAIGALVFAVHPVQVESVAWVAGLKDVLCGAMSLAALWQYVLFARPATPAAAPPSPTARKWHYGLATGFFILALLAKPSGMVVPLAALVIDRFLFRRAWRRVGAALAPWAAMALVCAVAAKFAQPVPVSPDAGRVWARPLLGAAAVAFYLFKLVWPAKLAVQYHASPAVLLAGRWIWFAWLAPAALAVLVLSVRRRTPWPAVAAGLFLVPILPVLGLVPFQFERLSLTADHYLYFAMIGPALAVAAGLASLRRARVAGAVICTACLVALGVRSYLQTLHWQDTKTLFEHELAVNPDSEVAYNQLAGQAIADGDLARAEEFALQSIRLEPNREEAYITLGAALARQHRPKEAMAAYRRAIELNPQNPVALRQLASLLAQNGQVDEAIPLIRNAIALDSLSPSAHRDLGLMLATKGRLPEAISESQIAVGLDPSDSEAQTNLGVLLAASGRVQEGIVHLQEALRLDPQSSKARLALQSFSGPRPPASR